MNTCSQCARPIEAHTHTEVNQCAAAKSQAERPIYPTGWFAQFRDETRERRRIGLAQRRLDAQRRSFQ